MGCVAGVVVCVARTVEGVESPGGLKLAHRVNAATTPSLALLLLLFSSHTKPTPATTKKSQKESLFVFGVRENKSQDVHYVQQRSCRHETTRAAPGKLAPITLRGDGDEARRSRRASRVLRVT